MGSRRRFWSYPSKTGLPELGYRRRGGIGAKLGWREDAGLKSAQCWLLLPLVDVNSVKKTGEGEGRESHGEGCGACS